MKYFLFFIFLNVFCSCSSELLKSKSDVEKEHVIGKVKSLKLVEYDVLENKELEIYSLIQLFDTNGNEISGEFKGAVNSRSRNELFYNDENVLLSRNLIIDGKLISKIQYLFTEDGLLSKSIESDSLGNNIREVKYDSLGNDIEEIEFVGNRKKKIISKYDYASGFIEKIYYDDNGDEIRSKAYEYSGNLLISFGNYQAKKKSLKVLRYEYITFDEISNWTLCKIYEADSLVKVKKREIQYYN